MTEIPLPEAVFFDWDGTLVDSFHFLCRAHSHVRNEIGRPELTTEQFERYFGMPREHLYEELYAPHQDKAKTLFESYVNENHLEQISPMPGAEKLLDMLAELGIKTGVVTNKKPSFVLEEIGHLGWQKHFVSVVGAGEAKQDKPAADPLLLAIEKGGGHAGLENIWYVGDTETDLKCAREAKCISIFIQNQGNTEELIDVYQPAVVVKNCDELCGFLLQSRGK